MLSSDVYTKGTGRQPVSWLIHVHFLNEGLLQTDRAAMDLLYE